MYHTFLNMAIAGLLLFTFPINTDWPWAEPRTMKTQREQRVWLLFHPTSPTTHPLLTDTPEHTHEHPLTHTMRETGAHTHTPSHCLLWHRGQRFPRLCQYMQSAVMEKNWTNTMQTLQDESPLHQAVSPHLWHTHLGLQTNTLTQKHAGTYKMRTFYWYR